MNFLKKMWAGVKSGFNWIKKHKVISFLVGGTLIGTGLGMAMGFGLLPSLLGGAAATLGLFAVGGAVFGAGVLVGGLVLLAAMGIGNLLGIGKKDKDKETPPPAVAPADPTPIGQLGESDGLTGGLQGDAIAPTPITDAAPLGETGLDPVAVNDLDVSSGQRGQLGSDAEGTGFAAVMGDEAPIQPLQASDVAPITPTPITPANSDDGQLPPEARVLNMPLGEPVLK